MKKIIFLAALLCFAASTYAMPISYDEIASGDLDGSQTLTLGVGSNTVTGTLTFSNNSSFPTDVDDFNFVVDLGDTLTAISMDIALLNIGSGSFFIAGWGLNIGSSTLFEDVLIPSTGVSLFSAAVPLSSGTYAMINTGLTGSVSLGEFRIAAYTISLNVTSVPEPGTLSLLALGLAGIAYRLHRKPTR